MTCSSFLGQAKMVLEFCSRAKQEPQSWSIFLNSFRLFLITFGAWFSATFGSSSTQGVRTGPDRPLKYERGVWLWPFRCAHWEQNRVSYFPSVRLLSHPCLSFLLHHHWCRIYQWKWSLLCSSRHTIIYSLSRSFHSVVFLSISCVDEQCNNETRALWIGKDDRDMALCRHPYTWWGQPQCW